MRSKILFIGKATRKPDNHDLATSAAADSVQQQIVFELARSKHVADYFVHYQEPHPKWPRGSLYIGTQIEAHTKYAGYLNFALIKSIWNAVRVFVTCLSFRPTTIIQYNSYLFDNLAILGYAAFHKIPICIIVQDIRYGPHFKRIVRYHDRVANSVLRFFSLVVIITEQAARRIKLSRYVVFPGGVTKSGYELLSMNNAIGNFALFTGALEPYNGIDQLLELWQDPRVKTKLHIFGSGSLSAHVRERARTNAKIIYHGFQPPSEVQQWQSRARFNLCLRYRSNIEDTNFFPSKFFNLACAKGLLVVNRFTNLPNFMDTCIGVMDNLEEFIEFQALSDEMIERTCQRRRQDVLRLNNWDNLIGNVIHQMCDSDAG